MKRIQDAFLGLRTRLGLGTIGIQLIVASAFSLVAGVILITVSLVLFGLFSGRMVDMKTESAEQFLNQTKHGLEDFLRSNRSVSDALFYSCIKNKDFQSESIDEELNLIYESNKDNIVRIALYTDQGDLLSAVPVAQRENPEKIRKKGWFTNATQQVENLHFTLPYVEMISEDASDGHRWVITLSRAVELNQGPIPKRGVLVLDLKYSTIQQMIDKVNVDDSKEYIYLCDGEGKLIYHPKRLWLNHGYYHENTLSAAILSDGANIQKIDGKDYIVVTKTVSYTGWKLVSVTPKEGFGVSQYKLRYFFVFFIAVAILSMLLINRQISSGITRPLVRLDASIHDVESGNLNPDIYVGGPREVEHLGKTLEQYLNTIRELMDRVVAEQELKRQSELDALQSQINPHFLYNTLDSVIWMIEDEQNEGAVYMIKELSKLLRISINKGRSLITIRDELRHAQSYINIQQMRYKNQFSCQFQIEEAILNCCTIKLVVQPLLENAINHGVQGMDDDGEILVKGYRQGSKVCLEVIDNGYGMTQDQIERIFQDQTDRPASDLPARRGNGVGLKNVNSRIRMQFGDAYGLEIESEIEEGTTMRLLLPYMIYEDMEETRKEGQ